MSTEAKSAMYVWLEPSLHRQLRIRAAETGMSAAVIVRQLLADFLAKQPAGSQAAKKGGVA